MRLMLGTGPPSIMAAYKIREIPNCENPDLQMSGCSTPPEEIKEV
jgi:hypothetical protein